jgi:GntR family transcriptional regulator of vanillate catabolism
MPTRGLSVTQELRDKVLDGEFKPGSRLKEADLSERLGVSRTPVRNALGMLAAEGLVIHAPNSGFTVRSFTVQDIENVYDCRAVLEGLAARSAAESGLSDTARGVLHRNLYDAAQVRGEAVWNDDVRAKWSQLNEEFHEVIFEASANLFLSELISKTRAIPYLRKVKFDWHDLEFMMVSSYDHDEIFEAIIAGQGARTEHLAREHVYKAGQRLAKYWRRNLTSPEEAANQEPLDAAS